MQNRQYNKPKVCVMAAMADRQIFACIYALTLSKIKIKRFIFIYIYPIAE